MTSRQQQNLCIRSKEKLQTKHLPYSDIPIESRDSCSHLLIPLNKCRRESWWNPNLCEQERHDYEKCQYNDYCKRCKEKFNKSLTSPGKYVAKNLDS